MFRQTGPPATRICSARQPFDISTEVVASNQFSETTGRETAALQATVRSQRTVVCCHYPYCIFPHSSLLESARDIGHTFIEIADHSCQHPAAGVLDLAFVWCSVLRPDLQWIVNGVPSQVYQTHRTSGATTALAVA